MASVRFVSTFNKNQYKIKVLRNEFNDYCSYSIIVALVTLVAFDFYECGLMNDSSSVHQLAKQDEATHFNFDFANFVFQLWKISRREDSR